MRVPYPVRLLLIPVVMAPLLGLNGLLLHILARQSLAASHPRASGLITYSQVVEDADTESDSYGFEVRYTYAVKGMTYESSRYRYAAWSSSNKGRVEDLARRFPVGSRVPVFYDPRSPWEAVLITGMDGMYLYLLLCVNPLNMAMAMWVRQALRYRDGGWLAGVHPEDRVSPRASDDEMSPLAVGIVAVGIASFVSIFVMGAVMAVYPSLMAAALAWGGVLATGVFFAMRHRAKRAPRGSTWFSRIGALSARVRGAPTGRRGSAPVQAATSPRALRKERQRAGGRSQRPKR